MEVYFLKSVACLAVFLLFYKLFFEKETMHVFKRFYLLAAMLSAVAIPFITFTTYVEGASKNFQPVQGFPIEGNPEAPLYYLVYLERGLWIIYILGVLFFSIKFFRNFREILQRIKKNPKVKEDNFINVLLSEKMNPHTFFSYIFLNKIKYEKNEIPKDVITHEQAHAVQKHSLDILIVEVTQIIFWFNPLLFLLKDAIKLNHEFLADASVLQKGTDPSLYQKTLLSYSSGGIESGLVNPINYSSIKKRFKVMNTKTSKTAVWARSLLILPLLAMLVYGFSTKKVLEKDQNESDITAGPNQILELKMDSEGTIFQNENELKLEQITKLKGSDFSSYSINASPDAPQDLLNNLVKVVSGFGIAGTVGVCTTEEFQEKATPEMIAEYNKLAKHYNKNEITEKIVQEEGFKRMLSIYKIMTDSQRKNAEKLPPPPPPSAAPEPVKGEGEDMPVPPPPPAPPAKVLVDAVEPPPPPVKEAGFFTPPPPPPPITFEELIADGATFYYNGKLIEPEKAKNLVEVQKKVNVEIRSMNDEKPVVKLTDKKNNK